MQIYSLMNKKNHLNSMNKENKVSQKYILDLSGKFLFMRHGQSFFNRLTEESRRYNPELCDAHLSEEGIKQAKSRQEDINKLNLEKVYVSPYHRALETMSYALENHPNINNIIVTVHPKIGEIIGCGHDFIFDIKQNKKEFNMNSKVKVDWSIFDEYTKKSKYGENFYFFENMNLLDEKTKEELYLKLKSLYDNGEIAKYREEIGKFLKDNLRTDTQFESFKHSHERFEEFKRYLHEEFKDTINNKDKKVLCVSHGAFIRTATSPVPFLKDEIKETIDNLYYVKNAEIISLLI